MTINEISLLRAIFRSIFLSHHHSLTWQQKEFTLFELVSTAPSIILSFSIYIIHTLAICAKTSCSIQSLENITPLHFSDAVDRKAKAWSSKSPTQSLHTFQYFLAMSFSKNSITISKNEYQTDRRFSSTSKGRIFLS